MSAQHTPGYSVTSDGRVFSVSHNWRGYGDRELKYHPDEDGYPCVRLTIDGKRKRHAVHRLVAAKHLPIPPHPNAQVCHLDGDKTNNDVSNLVWGSAFDNALDRERHGRTSRGAKHSAAIKAGLGARNDR